MASLTTFYRSQLFVPFLIVFVDVLGMGITIPVMPLYAQGELGASAFEVALTATVFFAAQMLAAPLLGQLSDRVGRKPVLVLSQLGTCAALIMSGAAPALWVLFAARVLDGVTGGNVTVVQAHISDISAPQDRARSMGVVHAAFGAGFMFGPALGGVLGAELGPRVPFFVAACLSVLTIALTIFKLKESHPPAAQEPSDAPAPRKSLSGVYALSSMGELASLPGMAPLLLIGFAIQLAMFCFQATWVLWAERVLFAGYEPRAVQHWMGAVFTLVGTVGVLTQAFIVGPAVRRFGERTLIAFGLTARGVASVVMASWPLLLPTMLVLIFPPMGNGLAQPSLIALVTYVLPPARRGEGMGMLAAVEGFGRVLGPMLSGVLFERVSPGAPMMVAGVLSWLIALLALRLPARAAQTAAAS